MLPFQASPLLLRSIAERTVSVTPTGLLGCSWMSVVAAWPVGQSPAKAGAVEDATVAANKPIASASSIFLVTISYFSFVGAQTREAGHEKESDRSDKEREMLTGSQIDT